MNRVSAAGIVALALMAASTVPVNAAPPGAVLRAPVRSVCGAPQIGTAQCHSLVAFDSHRAGPLVYSSPPGYNPVDFWAAYSLPPQTGGSWLWNGQTVAIVDAYDDPSAEVDLATYRNQFGLPPCTSANGCFLKVNQRGGKNAPPQFDDHWALEISLDLQIVSAICSDCRIVLVETKNNSFTNLMAGVDQAYHQNATVISNSWGALEFSSEAQYDSHFNQRNAAGTSVAVTASSGDGGYGHFTYPAASPYVSAVGGTRLVQDSITGTWEESAWNSAGSGCSSYEPQPSWQSATSSLAAACSTRAVADVAFDAVIASVYDSAGYQGQSGWFAVSGTSIGAPAIASIYALAGNSGSVRYGSYPYSHPGGLFDVLTGGGGSSVCSPVVLCTAEPGWDGPTGLGSPRGVTSF